MTWLHVTSITCTYLFLKRIVLSTGLKGPVKELAKKREESKGVAYECPCYGVFVLKRFVFVCVLASKESPWEKYLMKKKEKRKAAKLARMKKLDKKDEEDDEEKKEGGEGDSGFDDPFFQHDVTTATVVSACSVKLR